MIHGCKKQQIMFIKLDVIICIPRQLGYFTIKLSMAAVKAGDSASLLPLQLVNRIRSIKIMFFIFIDFILIYP
ncbi:hypothetical protein ACU52_04500 [Xylanibacter rarus]|uniref:Uncharacterized protein n=1 Tax=Xylanibacter rarus TaxID=1676614 RepID=A0A8E1QYG1_9BACT|nr:hypothetical protein ACU52_04500 [Xylanibacter rarus]